MQIRKQGFKPSETVTMTEEESTSATFVLAAVAAPDTKPRPTAASHMENAGKKWIFVKK